MLPQPYQNDDDDDRLLSPIVLVTKNKVEDGILCVDADGVPKLIWGQHQTNKKFRKNVSRFPLDENYYVSERDNLLGPGNSSINIAELQAWIDPPTLLSLYTSFTFYQKRLLSLR
jgi:hypothetical protein